MISSLLARWFDQSGTRDDLGLLRLNISGGQRPALHIDPPAPLEALTDRELGELHIPSPATELDSTPNNVLAIIHFLEKRKRLEVYWRSPSPRNLYSIRPARPTIVVEYASSPQIRVLYGCSGIK